MAANLTGQVRNIAEVTTAVALGDLSKKITVDVKGEILELKNTINTMVDQLNSFASEVTRVAREVGTEGKLGGQAQVRGVAGTWADLTDNVNLMADNLTGQVRNIADVTTAVARGDLSKKITVDVKGEILELKNTINTMVDQLNGFASEVTRVAREVGTEGKLGGQAHVRGVAGTWKDLTDNVNVMAANLTNQVRGIVKVVTAVADGDLKQKLTVEAKGEFAALGKAEAAARIAAGVAMFEALGWPLAGFVPPAWLASAGARDALAECSHPFRYMSVRSGLYHLPQWRFERTANLCYSPTHAWRRAYSRLEIRNQWRRARRVSLLRLSLHPQDARVPQVLRHWERLVEQTLATRRIVTKRDAVLAAMPRAGRSSPAADDGRAAVPSDAPPARAIS